MIISVIRRQYNVDSYHKRRLFYQLFGKTVVLDYTFKNIFLSIVPQDSSEQTYDKGMYLLIFFYHGTKNERV